MSQMVINVPKVKSLKVVYFNSQPRLKLNEILDTKGFIQ